MHSVTSFRHRRKQRIINYLGGKCVVCERTDQLEIDHIDPATKLYTLSGNNLNRTWEYLLSEIDKCQLLCKEHHLEKTRSESKNKTPWNKGLSNLSPDSHGNWQSYDQRKCRCDICKNWKRLYRNKLITSSGNPIVP